MNCLLLHLLLTFHFQSLRAKCFVSCCTVAKLCLFVTPWSAARQAPLSFTVSWGLLQFMSIESVRLSNHLSFVIPFSCLQSFQASGSFPVSQFFASGGQSIGASASVLPMNIQDRFPLGLTGLISLLSKGLSRVFSSTTVQKQVKIAFSSVQFSHLVVSYSLRPCEPQHARPPCPSPTPGVHPNPCPSSR